MMLSRSAGGGAAGAAASSGAGVPAQPASAAAIIATTKKRTSRMKAFRTHANTVNGLTPDMVNNSFNVIAVARNGVHHRDLLHREIRDDLDFLFVHDQHLLDAHAVAEALAMLGLQGKRHSGLD